MKRIILLYLLSFFLFSSCAKSDFSIKRNNLLRFGFIDNNKINDKEAIILIPFSGCGSCIKDLLLYSRDNLSNKKIYFIIIGLDKKEVYSYYNFDKNITIDNKLLLESLKMVSTAPVVYFLKDGVIIEEVVVKSNNSKKIINRLDSIN